MRLKRTLSFALLLLLILVSACAPASVPAAETPDGSKSDAAAESAASKSEDTTEAEDPTEPDPVPYWTYDLSGYTPVFVDLALIAIVKGDDWISCDELYPYGYEDLWWDSDAQSSNTTFIDDQEFFYIYNVDGLVKKVDDLPIHMSQGLTDGNVSNYIDWDQYQALVPDTSRFYITCTNPKVGYPKPIDVFKDETTARYILDLDGDGKKETVLRRVLLEDLTITSFFEVTRGKNLLLNWDYSWEIEADELSDCVDMGYTYLNGPEGEYKALFMDLNDDGVSEIITSSTSYGGHNISYSLYARVAGEWQKVADLYIGD